MSSKFIDWSSLCCVWVLSFELVWFKTRRRWLLSSPTSYCSCLSLGSLWDCYWNSVQQCVFPTCSELSVLIIVHIILLNANWIILFIYIFLFEDKLILHVYTQNEAVKLILLMYVLVFQNIFFAFLNWFPQKYSVNITYYIFSLLQKRLELLFFELFPCVVTTPACEHLEDCYLITSSHLYCTSKSMARKF